MQYQLIRSKRKTIAISFDRDGNLIVKAPFWMAKYQIESFVQEKEEWIKKTARRLEIAGDKEMQSHIKLENGDELPFLGEKMTLTVIREDRSRGRIECVKGRLLLWLPYEADYQYKKELVEKWYRRQAAEIFLKKAETFAKLLDVKFENIRIKDQKSRWGSCSGKGNLNFNFRILMAPEAVCDYVIKHELCHLIYMNHSKDFWQLLEGICPEYKRCKKWLKDYGQKLYIF